MPALADPFQFLADLIDPPELVNWEPLPHQIPPKGNWFYWMLMGGRGAGKTAAAARFAYEHAFGPPCLSEVPGGHWMALVGPTMGDAITSAVEGPSGLRKWDRGLKVQQKAGGTTVTFSNGAQMKVFGAYQQEDVERFRSGGNRCMCWLEEMAAWRYLEETWEQIRYGLRVGPRPHCIISTTPKARKLIKKLVKDAIAEPGYGQVTSANTFANPHLDARVKQALKDDYEGTRMGRQELYAELLEDVENSLWTPDIIDRHRINLFDFPEKLDRLVVGVDPQGKEGGDETGIVVGGIIRTGFHATDHRSHGFVLGDYTVDGQPEVWAKQAVRAFDDHLCNEVVAEINNGGDMVKATLRTQRSSLPVHVVHATRGKARRAEPVSALYEQGRIHHVGLFRELEDQMTGFDAIDPDPSWSPDRMDAMVWAMTRLMVRSGGSVSQTTNETTLRSRR